MDLKRWNPEVFLFVRGSIRRVAKHITSGPQRLLAATVLVYVGILVICAVRQPYEVPLPQFLLGVGELTSGSRVHSTFLPIGYPLILAAAYHAGAVHGEAGMHFAACALNIGIAACILLCIRGWLVSITSPRYATVAAFAIALYPELIRNLTKVSDTNLTTLLVLAVLLALTALRGKPHADQAIAFGVVVSAAVLVRPNLLLFLFAALPAMVSLPWPKRKRLLALIFGTSICFYSVVTMAAHGRPFLPQNGPYNLFAGANEFSERALLDWRNGEVSIVPALGQLGFYPALQWSRPSDQPGVDDARDLRYAPVYRAATWRFVRTHPWQMARLTLLKLFTLLRPDAPAGNPPPWANVWMALKTLVRMAVPAWLVAIAWQIAWQYRRRPGIPGSFVPLLATLYVLPFLLTNADPRFRTPLDVLLLADLARIVFQWRSRYSNRRYFMSLPRPAA